MKKQYVISERAHFMCPNMHFGILMEIEKEYYKVNVEATLKRMAEAHPFLKCLIAYEERTEKLYYKITDCSQINLVIKEDISSIWSDYKKISKRDWNVFENGLLKVYIYPQKQGMTVLFITHHLLVDGRGLLDIAQEFANDYVCAIPPVYVEEELIGSIYDLPKKSGLLGISKMLVKQANRQWEKEKHVVSYEQYESFVEEYSKNHSIEYETYEIDNTAVAQMVHLCKENGFSMNDLLMAHMYVKTGTQKIIIAADIRNMFSKYRKGALGNYSTAMGIHCKSKTTDVIEMAKEVHKLVQKHLKNNRALMLVLACYFEMSPTLLDAAAISALGGFESKAGKFVGGGMFGFGQPKSYSITNLGKIENENIKSIVFIPPASPAAKLTLGVVTLNGKMRACSSRNEED
ncbi:MAG: hypothetical protein IJB96_01530 [Lachnospira sp.]|nr:hypothetical protein [Lachnospira sp.]